MHVVGGEQRQPVRPRQCVEPVDPGDVVAHVEVARGEMAQGGELLHDIWQDRFERTGGWRLGNQAQPNFPVAPANAGVPLFLGRRKDSGVPAFAGMTI